MPQSLAAAQLSDRILKDVIVPALIDDVTDLRTKLALLQADVAAHRTSYNATLTKMDSDAGITDTNYAATNPMAALTSTALSAQQLTKK